MDFFSKQDEALKKSRTFYLVFSLAVILAVLILYFVLTGCLMVAYAYKPVRIYTGYPEPTSFIGMAVNVLPSYLYGAPPKVLSARPVLMLGIFTMGIILTASIYKTRAIKKGGGAYIAESMGGRLLDVPQSSKEKQLINIVEEMAIASGLPRPRLYVLDNEPGINAITAGLDYDDAVIAVTKGSLEHLTREELQGVMAHEFAHILNGDCALNLTMAGWLYGLLIFSIAGRDLLDFVKEEWDDGFSTSSQGRGQLNIGLLMLPVALIGCLLLLGGSIGKLAASMVQAAFSRQREYLADAFAVQFTRNPRGLSGALKKIAGLTFHGFVSSGKSLMMQSFFIVSPAKLKGLMQSHPPLEERIYTLEPSWDGEVEVIKIAPSEQNPEPAKTPLTTAFRNDMEALRNSVTKRGGLMETASSLENNWAGALVTCMLLASDKQCANKAEQSLEQAAGIYKEIPEHLIEAVHEPAFAGPLVVSIFLHDGELRARQLSITENYLGPEAAGAAEKLRTDFGDQLRLPLLGLASPTLKGFSPEQKGRLAKTVKELIACDGKLDLFEIAAWQILKKALGLPTASGKAQAATDLGNYLETLQKDTVKVMSIMAYLGTADDSLARQAFLVGMGQFNQWPLFDIIPRNTATSKELAIALERLGAASNHLKNKLVGAVITTALFDHQVNQKEYELLRALAAALDVPLPIMGLEKA